jgi:hypothetical protein
MHAVVVLVDDHEDAAMLAGVVKDVVRPDAAVALVPPVVGTGFFADSNAANGLDRWWQETVPSTAAPIYVMDFNPAVVPWLPGLDGRFIIRGCPADVAHKVDANIETPERAASSLELAARVLQHLAADGACSEEDADGLLAFAKATTTTPAAARIDQPTPPNPFDLLASMRSLSSPPAERHKAGDAGRTFSTRTGVAAPPSRVTAHSNAVPELPNIVTAPSKGVPVAGMNHDEAAHRTLGDLFRLPWRGRDGRRSDPFGDDLLLASALARRGSTVVAVGSRKGGVGKTSNAAGMSIVAGSLLDAVGHRAVIVDANVANPDAWGVLNLPPGAATVRDTIAALDANLDPPRPVFATTPALACYPETRETSEYSRHDIQLLAAHLRRGFTLAVIDLSNRLPDPTGGPEAAAAAYWLDVADAVVLPTAWSKQDFNGVLDYLELADLPPAVVAYITPRARRHREHPMTQRYLDAIAQKAHSVVQVADEADNVRYASMAGVPLDSVSRRLRSGYRALIEAVLRAAGVTD